MEIETHNAPVSRTMIWTGRILSALPVLFMLMGCIYAFANPQAVQKDFDKYGYPGGSLRILLFVELACVVLYAIPQTAVLGAILLTGYLGGAVATHVHAGESSFFFPIIFGIIIWLGLFFRDARVRALVPLRKIP